MFIDIVVGILVLIGSFFTLPVRWIKETGSRLAEIGERRSVVVEQTEDVPLLSWLLVCGRMVIALAAILVYPAIIIIAIVAAISDDNGAGGIIVAILFGWIPAILLLWVLGVWLELVSLGILTVQLLRQAVLAVQESNEILRLGTASRLPGDGEQS